MSQQIQITGGAKVRNLEGVLTGTAGVVNALGINVANGIPKLDGSGKILVAQLPNSVMEYKGTWNASTNTPTLANGTGNQGDVYLCSTAGTVNFGAGAITFAVGDQVIYSGTIWQKAGGSTGTVTSIAVTESGDALTITGSPITTSGTINIGFAGTSGQYVNGAGGLTTFPSLTGYVPYTGATANLDLGTYDLTTDIATLNQVKAVGSGGLSFNSNSGTQVALMGGGGGAGTTFYGGIIGTTASFASSGGSDSFAINHSSGSGIALNITKGGNGEGLYINKTSGSGNAATIIGTLNATTLVKSGGTSSQFLKADGSIDSSAYITLTSLSASSPLSYNNTTGAFTISQSNTSTNGFLSSTDWNTFNGKQNAITLTTTGTSGAATLVGSTLNIPNYTTDLSGYVTIGTTQTITGAKTFSAGIAATTGSFSSYIDASYTRLTNGIVLPQSGSRITSTGETTISVYSTNGILIGFPSGNVSGLLFNTSASNFYTFPNATGTVALTSDIPSVSGVYLPLAGGTMTGALNINLSGSTGLNVASDSVIFRANTGVGSPRQIELSMGGGSSTYLDAKGYGANYITDFGIRTYNSSGTAFNVFYGTSAGLVGIGTTDPLSKLHVIGTGTVVRFGEESGTTGKQLLFGINSSNGTSEIQSVWQGTANTPLALNPAGGNLGIGTSTPSDILDVQKNQNATTNFYFRNTDTTNTSSRSILNVIAGNVSTTIQSIHNDHSYINATNNLYFQSSGNVKMLITSGGNVGIGTTNPTPHSGSNALVIKGPSGVRGIMELWDGTSGKAVFQQVGGNTYIGNLDKASTGGDLYLLVNGNGSSADTGMLIKSNGNVCIGGTLPLSNAALTAYAVNGSNDAIISVKANNASGSNAAIYLEAPGVVGGGMYQDRNASALKIWQDSSNIGVQLTNNATSWGSYSDERLKDIIEPITGGLEKVKTLRTVIGKYKTDESDKRRVFLIAQDVQKVLPEAIFDDRSEEKLLSLQYTDIIPLLVNAIQEQQAQIEELKAKIK
jgi:hypothetical protein